MYRRVEKAEWKRREPGISKQKVATYYMISKGFTSILTHL